MPDSSFASLFPKRSLTEHLAAIGAGFIALVTSSLLAGLAVWLFGALMAIGHKSRLRQVSIWVAVIPSIATIALGWWAIHQQRGSSSSAVAVVAATRSPQPSDDTANRRLTQDQRRQLRQGLQGICTGKTCPELLILHNPTPEAATYADDLRAVFAADWPAPDVKPSRQEFNDDGVYLVYGRRDHRGKATCLVLREAVSDAHCQAVATGPWVLWIGPPRTLPASARP